MWGLDNLLVQVHTTTMFCLRLAFVVRKSPWIRFTSLSKLTPNAVRRIHLRYLLEKKGSLNHQNQNYQYHYISLSSIPHLMRLGQGPKWREIVVHVSISRLEHHLKDSWCSRVAASCYKVWTPFDWCCKCCCGDPTAFSLHQTHRDRILADQIAWPFLCHVHHWTYPRTQNVAGHSVRLFN